MNHSHYIKKISLYSIFLLLVWANILINTSFNSLPHTQQPYSPPLTSKTTQYLSMGYNNLVATLLWFKANAYYGAPIDPENIDYAYTSTLFTTITALYPKFEPVYYMAASIFPWNTQSTSLSKPLVLQAMVEFPHDWRWPYYRGFNAYWFDHNYQQAAHFFELSASKSNAPPLVSSLASRMHTQTGNIDTALNFLADLMQNKNDAHTQSSLLKQYKQLETEKQLQKIDHWLELLPENQHNLLGIQQLKERGHPIPQLLADGGKITFIDHVLMSSKTNKRFKLFIPPKRQGVIHHEPVD